LRSGTIRVEIGRERVDMTKTKAVLLRLALLTVRGMA